MSGAIVKLPAASGFNDSSEIPPPPASGAPPASHGVGSAGGSTGATASVAKKQIIIDTDEHRVADEATVAISYHPEVYKRGGMLVHVVRDEVPAGSLRTKGAPSIRPLPLPRLRELLTACAEFVVRALNDKGQLVLKRVHPPDWLVKEVDARGEWPHVRPLVGVVESPALRADGTVLATPGYDVATGLLYEPNAVFPKIPLRPSPKQVAAAKNSLLAVVKDFPFVSEAGRASWIALVLSMFGRSAYGGPTPLGVFDANTPGTGKGLAADTISLIADGRSVPPTPQGETDADDRKLITTAAMAGTRLMLFDNLTRPLGSGALEAVLTSTQWRDRILGVSKNFEGEVFTIWMTTGNNITFRKRDTIRRTLHIRLETNHENPEQRDDVTHKDLRAWVLANRAKLVAAALTVLRGYCAAGKPDMGLRPWGSFEGWSNLIRNAVVWVGLDDPAKTREELARDGDTELAALRELLVGWEQMCQHVGHSSGGCTAAAALTELEKDDADARMDGRAVRFRPLRDALSELINTAPGKLPTAGRVGALFRRLRARVVDGKKLTWCTNQGNHYWIAIAAKGGDGGLGGGENKQHAGARQEAGSGSDATDGHQGHQDHQDVTEGPTRVEVEL